MLVLYVFLVLFSVVGTTLSAPANIFNIYSSPDKKCSVELVAFSVGRTTGFSVSKTSRIPMDHVYYNKEGHFDMSTSEFTAPVDGVYEFSFGATSAIGKPIALLLYVTSNGQEKAVAVTFNYHAGTQSYKQASTVVYVELKTGDKASLWLHEKKAIYGQRGAVATQFSGHLLK